MCEHLDKAKGALSAAAQHEHWTDKEKLLRIAEVQAQVSQADSLAQLVQLLQPPLVYTAPAQTTRHAIPGGGGRYQGYNNAP